MTYIPGTCNIDKAQLLKRKRFLARCLGLTVWCIALIHLLGLNNWFRLAMVIPFTLSFLAAQQVYFKFCFVFGLKGVFGLDQPGETHIVKEADDRAADRTKAIKMIATSVIGGILLTLLYFYLPV